MKLQTKILAALLGASFLFPAAQSIFSVDLPAAEAKAKKPAAQEENGSYEYVSEKYGYKMLLPQKPLAVIPVSNLEPDKFGDVIIFQNEEYNITYGYIVYYNDFSETSVPDFNLMNDETARAYAAKLKERNPYDSVEMIQLSPKNKGLYAVTSKVFYIDTDDDGVGDEKAEADSQNAEIFFRANKGGRFRMELIKKPDLTPETVAAFKKAAESFQEI